MPPRLSGHRHLHLQVHHLPWQDKAVIQKTKVISTATCLYSPGYLRTRGGRLIESRSSADCRLGNEREHPVHLKGDGQVGARLQPETFMNEARHQADRTNARQLPNCPCPHHTEGLPKSASEPAGARNHTGGSISLHGNTNIIISDIINNH